MPPLRNLRGRNVRCLFIGVNYGGTPAALRGCVNDVSAMQSLLLGKLRFPETDTRVLVDEDSYVGVAGQPTKAGILEALAWLVDGTKEGDSCFLHFSGHGTRVKDTSGDEADGFDEALVPSDYKSNGLILDDDIYKVVAEGLHPGARLTAVVDCCHSGTIMDLPHVFVANDANARALEAVAAPASSGAAADTNGFATSLTTAFSKIGSRFMRKRSDTDAAKLGKIIMFSGCQDDQTSADVGGNANAFEKGAADSPGAAGGACTKALCEVIVAQTKRVTYASLLAAMRQNLKSRGYTQVPQLSSSQPVDPKEYFGFF